MKKTMAAVVLMGALCLTATAGPDEFTKGAFYVTPQVGLNKWTIPFGASAEYAITPNIGIGGTVMFWMWSEEWIKERVIAFSADALYHFTKFQAAKLDLSAGASLGFTTYSWDWKSGYEDVFVGEGSSGLYLSPFVNGRYWFSPKMAVNLRLYVGLIGDWSGVGGQLGVTFRVK